MRRRLIVANWKMQGDLASVESWAAHFATYVVEYPLDVVWCPPAVFIDRAVQGLHASDIMVGAQTVSHYNNGAYTGDISAAMLADLGCRYVIIGHSERRRYYAENDAIIAAQWVAAQVQGLVPILCIGENLEQREAGDAQTVVADQLAAIIDVVGIEALASAVIAYEPLWAIGTAQVATPQQAQTMHAFIRTVVQQHKPEVAAALGILYGGSVKANNAAGLLAMPDIDGLLVGGASLDATEFAAICATTDVVADK